MNQNIVQPPAKEPFTLYIVKHPSFDDADGVASFLHDHFGSDRYKNIVGEVGLSVFYREAGSLGENISIPIEWDESSVTVVIVLADSNLVNDTEWLEYVNRVSNHASSRLASVRLVPIMMDSHALEHGFEVQGIPWVHWPDSPEDKRKRLIRTLLHDFIQLSQNHLDFMGLSQGEETDIGSYMKKIQIFISHSTHDEHGLSSAEAIGDWINKNSPMSSFMAVRDIPPGLPFSEVLLHEVTNSLVVVIYTDTYSSREWCRREVIAAKKCGVPIIVVDYLNDMDSRSIPYMGNVPVIRANDDRDDWIGRVIECLLDETFQAHLWLILVEHIKDPDANTLFTARPPELITLGQFDRSPMQPRATIVYPEPKLDPDEVLLFTTIAPEVQILSIEEWMV